MKIDANGWLDEAIEINCMHKSMSRAGYKPTHIVLHGTAGGSSAENIANYFATSDVQSSAHIVIGQDGHVVQCVSCNVAAWGNGGLVQPRFPFPANVNPNYYTISIEHVKAHTDNSDQLTDAQAQASFRVVQVICDTYGIEKRPGDEHGGIISHADLDSVDRARCPGPYPWAQLWAYLKGASMGTVPKGWSYDPVNKVFTSPNGKSARYGFGDYMYNYQQYKGRPWDEDDWILVEEYHADQFEISNPDFGGGQQMITRKHVLAWKGQAIEEYTGQEWIAMRAKIAEQAGQLSTLQKQVNDLKSQLAERQQPAVDDKADWQQVAALASKYIN